MGLLNLNNKTPSLPMTLFASLFQDEGKDVGLQLRARTSEKQMIKQICSAAFHGQQMVLFVSFKDKAHALNTLQQHGIIIPETKDGVTRYKFVD